MELAEKSFDKPVVIVTQVELKLLKRVFEQEKTWKFSKNVRDFGIAQRKFILDAMVCS
jgi:hypothetical protein